MVDPGLLSVIANKEVVEALAGFLKVPVSKLKNGDANTLSDFKALAEILLANFQSEEKAIAVASAYYDFLIKIGKKPSVAQRMAHTKVETNFEALRKLSFLLEMLQTKKIEKSGVKNYSEAYLSPKLKDLATLN